MFHSSARIYGNLMILFAVVEELMISRYKFSNLSDTEKPVENDHSKIDKTKALTTNGT